MDFGIIWNDLCHGMEKAKKIVQIFVEGVFGRLGRSLSENETKKTPGAWGAKSCVALFVSFALFIVSVVVNAVFVIRETFAIWPLFGILAATAAMSVIIRRENKRIKKADAQGT